LSIITTRDCGRAIAVLTARIAGVAAVHLTSKAARLRVHDRPIDIALHEIVTAAERRVRFTLVAVIIAASVLAVLHFRL